MRQNMNARQPLEGEKQAPKLWSASVVDDNAAWIWIAARSSVTISHSTASGL